MDKIKEKIRAISLLAEEINKRRMAIFIGAGCSISAGLPSWKDLIDGLLKDYQIQTKDTNLLRLASGLERKIGPLSFREKIAERLISRPDTITSLHDNIVSLDVNLFITTNYDHLLEDAFRKYGFSPHVIINDKDINTIDPTRKTIVKLHGDIDSLTSLVITSKDYKGFKSDHKEFMDWFNGEVSYKTILFLGTSFDDPRLKEMDEHVLGLFDDFRRQPFIFLKTPENQKSNDQFDIDLADFEALCEWFIKDHGFFVVPIEKYDEIEDSLRELQKKALEKKK